MASASSPTRAARRSPTSPCCCPTCAWTTAALEQELARPAASGPQPVCLPGAVQLLLRAASAGVDRAGPRPRLGCAAGRGRLRPHQPARPVARSSPISCRSRSTRCSATRPASARCSPARTALAKLHRPWFAGGTITVASVQGDKYYLADGAAGLRGRHARLPEHPGRRDRAEASSNPSAIDVIHERVRCLTGWLLENLTAMRHSTGEPLVRIYGPTTTEQRGGAVTVNFFDQHGNAARPSLRSKRNANKVEHLPADGLLLQPRRGRGGAGHLAHGTGGLFRPAHATTSASRWTTSASASTGNPAARCASRWAWSRTSTMCRPS